MLTSPLADAHEGVPAERLVPGTSSKETWQLRPVSPMLGRAMPDDFVIEPLVDLQKSNLTLILVGRPKD